MPVVVVEVDAEDVLEVPAVQDQHAVEAFAAERPDPTFRMGVRVRRPHRGADDPDALASEHRVEVAAELAVPVVEQEPEWSITPPSCIVRLRACWVTQRPSGLVVLATNSIRRRSSETQNST
jgi:hypothetical protein